MVNLYTLSFYENLDGCYDGFFIGVFTSYEAAEHTAKKYLQDVSGFKDYPCRYEIKEKKVIAGTDELENVSMIWGWNNNESLDAVDIWESDLYSDKTEAQAALMIAQKEIERQEWSIDTYQIDVCLWQKGFIKA